MSRVTGASLAGGTSQSYTYDRDGNRLTKTDAGVTTTYTYDRADELISQTIAGVPATFTYNAYGDLTQAPDATNAVTAYAYDQAGRLTSLTPPAASATTYTYDALGRIATRVTPTGTDTYSYIGASETVWQVANAGLTVTSAIDAAGVRTAVTPGGTVGLTLPDLHGSIAAELTQNATGVLSALRYDPYGLVTAAYDAGGGFTNPWRYGGRLDLSPDAANPRYDVSARDYLPTAGVFASLDTYAGTASDPRSMNRFLYAEANPATLIDPSGHCTNWIDDQCRDHRTTSAEQHQMAAQHAALVTARENRIETGYLNRRTSGGAVAPAPASPYVEYLPEGTFTDSRGNVTTNLECLQWSGIRCRDTIDIWSGVGRTQTQLGGWSPEEYLAGMSTQGARNTLRLLSEFETGQETGNWTAWGLDAGGMAAQATLEGASVVGGLGTLGRLVDHASSGVTVLGRTADNYVAKGRAMGANVLDIPGETWAQLSIDERWALNRQFLDDALARGDDFKLVSNVKDAREGSFFAKEIDYLGSKGYSVTIDGAGLVPPGPWSPPIGWYEPWTGSAVGR